MRNKSKDAIFYGRTALIVLSLIALELLVRGGFISQLILSAPSAIAVKMWQDILTGELLAHLSVTAAEFGIAFLISMLVGTLCGITFFHYRLLGTAIEPLLLALYAAPTILLYPVFLALFGLGSAAVIGMAVVFGTIPIMVNVSAGLTGVERIYVKLGLSLKATPWQLFWKIMLPAATPTIFTGIRMGFTYAFVGVIAVEFLIFSGGLGKMVSWRYFTFDTVGIYSGVVTIIIVAALINTLVGMAENRIRARWA